MNGLALTIWRRTRSLGLGILVGTVTCTVAAHGLLFLFSLHVAG